MPAPHPLRTLARRAHKVAEAVAALLLAVIFVGFLIQIVFRYAFNFPVGWTSDLSVAAWLWLVLWGAAFVLKDEDEIRIDMLTQAVGRRTRIGLGIVAAVAIVVLFAMSLPAAYDYVSFMKVESSSYLKIRFDWMYSIYIVFAVAVIARYVWKLAFLLRGREPASIDGPQDSPTP
ncbi:MAG: TRAP transporter small permease subunit [Rubrivivax sp.]|nr:TRAP transporter small permease subunit [Rubrivivax sp.]MDP3223306.1 TRAP transporter small permease subunit [Rubrivivax sp.]